MATTSSMKLPVRHDNGPAHFEVVNVEEVRQRLGKPLTNTAVFCAPGEETPRPDGYFDLMVSCNVIDRHKEPHGFVERLSRFVRPGGLLVLATPFDFKVEFTPDKSNWVRDIRELLPEGWEPMADGEAAYTHRFHSYSYPAYVCQVLAASASKATAADVIATRRFPTVAPIAKSS